MSLAEELLADLEDFEEDEILPDNTAVQTYTAKESVNIEGNILVKFSLKNIVG